MSLLLGQNVLRTRNIIYVPFTRAECFKNEEYIIYVPFTRAERSKNEEYIISVPFAQAEHFRNRMHNLFILTAYPYICISTLNIAFLTL